MDSETVRVLLIEDDPDDYYLTKELFAEIPGRKIALDWARDYEAGIEAIESCDHDAYLVDFGLGKRDGLELLREALSMGCKGPIILLTGAGDRDLALRALNDGAADFLVKGQIDAANLERTIRYALQQTRYAEELERKVHERTAELEQTNAELRRSEEFARTVLESSPDCVKVLDADGRLVTMNGSGLCLLEIDDFLDFCGKDWEALWPEEGRGRIAEAVTAALRGSIDRFQAFSPTAKGTPKWWDVIVAPVRDDQGRVTRLVSVSRDITEAKRVEESLRESESRFATAFNSSPQAITITSLETGKILEANETFVKMTGYSREEAVGRSTDELGLWKSGADRNAELAAVTRETRISNREYSFRMRDGSEITGLLSAETIEIGGEPCALTVIQDITERKAAEEALRASEERRHLAQDAGNVGIFDWDIVADKTYWSETMWAFYGEVKRDINPDEKFWSDHIHGTDRERVKSNIRQAVSSGSDKFADEYRILRTDGTLRWIEAVARISRDANGVATRMYGVNLDITHRKEAEEMIKRSEYQLRTVTDTVPALISYIDNSERYRFVNQKYIDWFGKPREKIIGKTISEIAGAQAYRAVKPRIEKVLAGKECTFEDELPLKGVGTRFVRVSYSPDVGVDGRVNGFYALISDQTDIKRSQDLLRSTEERIGLIMETLTDYAIFSTDSEGRVESWNRGAESIFGYSHAEIAGLSCEMLFAPEDVARGIPVRAMRTARQKGRARDERWHVRKDGSRFFASGVLMPLYVGGALTGYATVASDLTEKQRRADELQMAHDKLEVRVVERTKELAETNIALLQEMEEREVAEKQRIDLLRRLVSSQESERRRIARDIHDTLGQRLTALRLKIASLREAADANKEFASRVERLQEISERLDSEVSFMAWEMRPSALDDLGLAEAVGAFISEWSKHHEIPADFHSARLPHDLVNRETETHLYRITQEALNNIAKHSGAKNVSVLIERREGNLILIVEDDGKGFDPAKLPPPIESGKGLGLLGMSERATLMGGNVEIESAPGKGTTIYARVPFFNDGTDIAERASAKMI